MAIRTKMRVPKSPRNMPGPRRKTAHLETLSWMTPERARRARAGQKIAKIAVHQEEGGGEVYGLRAGRIAERAEVAEMRRQQAMTKSPRRSKKKHSQRGFTGNFGPHELPVVPPDQSIKIKDTMAKKMTRNEAEEYISRTMKKHRGYDDEWFISEVKSLPTFKKSAQLREAVSVFVSSYPTKEPMATKRSSKRVKRSIKRPANRSLSSMMKGAKSANLSPKRAAKKTALAKRSGSSRELMSRKQSPWTNALGKVREKTPSKPTDPTYRNKVEFICRNPETGDEKTVYHKARAKSCADKGWEVLARPRPRPETNPKSKKYAGRRARA